MAYEFRARGVCAQGIRFEVENDIVTRVDFIGGCSGNTQGVARLAEGMTVDTVIQKLRGIQCGRKPTSCPDQLAQALEQLKAQSEEQ